MEDHSTMLAAKKKNIVLFIMKIHLLQLCNALKNLMIMIVQMID